MKTRILTRDPRTKEKGSTTAHVVTGYNHLYQMRQFAFDGRIWFYQPSNREPFQIVSPRDIPQNVVDLMIDLTGLTEDQLRNPDRTDAT